MATDTAPAAPGTQQNKAANGQGRPAAPVSEKSRKLAALAAQLAALPEPTDPNQKSMLALAKGQGMWFTRFSEVEAKPVARKDFLDKTEAIIKQVIGVLGEKHQAIIILRELIKVANTREFRAPEGDDFWSRYSPHHEFPLSVGASVVIHLLCLVLFATLAALYLRGGGGVAPMVDVVDAGGGGDPDGTNIGNEPERGREVVAAQPTTKSDDPFAEAVPENITLAPIPNIPVAPNTAEDIAKAARDKGRGGPGRGGGQFTGVGTGSFSGQGPGVQTARAKRMHRWDIRFKFDSYSDYVGQLKANGAIIAVPIGDNKMLVFEGGSKKEEALSDMNKRLNRIWFRHTDQGSVQGLLQTLGVSSSQGEVRVYFPHELEKQLLEKEKAFWKMEEDEIDRRNLLIRFDVLRKGGSYEFKPADPRKG